MVNKRGGAQSGKLGKNPHHCNVVGKVSSANGGEQHHHRRKVDAAALWLFALSAYVKVAVNKSRNADNAEGNQQEYAQRIEGEVVQLRMLIVEAGKYGEAPQQNLVGNEEQAVYTLVAVYKKQAAYGICPG